MAETVLNLAPPEVIVRPMITTDRAIDLYLGDLGRRGYSQRTRTTYSRLLYKFADRLPTDQDVSKVTLDDCRRFLDQWTRSARGTQAHVESVVSAFFKWLYTDGKIAKNPMDRMPRTKRIPAQDLDVLSVSTSDVFQLLQAARPGSELNAIAIAAYLGPRRGAMSRLRLRDYNRDTGELRFFEKGAKTIWKPVPAELRNVLDASIARGDILKAPRDYLVPPQGPLSRSGERDDRVIWRLVKQVAGRAGVEAHVHALRAAFAVFYLKQNERDTYGLQKLMGHTKMATTETYLRRYDERAAMQPVRELSWAAAAPDNIDASTLPQTAGFWLASSPFMGAGGFEPPLSDSSIPERAGGQQDALTPPGAA